MEGEVNCMAKVFVIGAAKSGTAKDCEFLQLGLFPG